MHPKTKQIDARVQALHFCEDGSDTPAAVSSVLAKPPYNGSDTRPVIHLALGIENTALDPASLVRRYHCYSSIAFLFSDSVDIHALLLCHTPCITR
jgi:hypothetical protein